MVDIHSHILPMVDDGATSWEMAVAMVDMAERDGITHMVASPHANYEYQYCRESHSALLQELQARTGDRIQLYLGCDFHLSFDNFEDALLHPARYTIGHTRYLLIELGDFSIPQQLPDMLFRLASRGIVPILTHPERNPILQQHPKRVSEWVGMGMLVQVTASSFTGHWGKTIQRLAFWYAEHNLVHVIASDAHSATRRPPCLSQARLALTKTFGEPFATALVESNPLAIVRNEPLPS